MAENSASAPFHQGVVLAVGDEVGPQKGTDQASTLGEMLGLHLLGQGFRPTQILVRVRFDKLLITGDRLVQVIHPDRLLLLVSHSGLGGGNNSPFRFLL